MDLSLFVITYVLNHYYCKASQIAKNYLSKYERVDYYSYRRTDKETKLINQTACRVSNILQRMVHAGILEKYNRTVYRHTKRFSSPENEHPSQLEDTIIKDQIK